MKKKLVSKFLVGALALCQIFACFQPALAEGERDVLSLAEPLVSITDASFTAYDSSGAEVTDYSNIPQNASVSIMYSFNVTDATNPADDVKSGDYFNITLPSSLTDIASFTPVTNQPMTVEWSGETYTIAHLDISAAGVATITFDSDIESLSDVSANFTIEGGLIDANIGNNSGITFQLWANGETYTIDFEDDPLPPETPNATIEKSGTYSAADNEITWTITVDSGDPGVTAGNVVVVDKLGENQTYISSSVDSTDISTNTDGDYVFSLGSVTGTTSFTLTTAVTDGAYGAEASVNTLTNDADLYVNASADPVDTSSASVDITTDWIQKSGVSYSSEGSYYIDWTITLNHNYRTIPANATVTDTLPGYLQIDASTVRRNGALPGSFGDSVGVTGQDITYTFGSDVTGVQTLTFTTKVQDDYFTQQSQTGFINTGVLHIGGDSYSATSANVSVGTSLIAKRGIGYDAANQLITWEIEVNRNAQAITSATVTDTLGGDQLFYESFGIARRDGGTTIGLTRVDTPDQVDDAANQYYYDSSTRILTVYLGNLTAADHPYLTFKTQVTNPDYYANNSTHSYTNASAVLVGGGITQSAVNNVSQSATSRVLAKASTAYDYAAKTISWTVTVNQNNMSMPDAIVTELVQDGQQYVAGSLLVNGSDPGSMLSVSGDTLTVALGAISSQTVITFDTVITDLSVFLSTNGNVTFRNNAQLSTGIAGAPAVSVWANRVVNNTPVVKSLREEYIPANGYIGWEAFVNPNQAPMSSASLTDTLQDGLELDIESVSLYYWNQAANGSMSVGNEIEKSAYSFTYDYATRLFVIHLPDGAQGYYLIFKTDVLKAGQYSNTIGFGGSYTGSGEASSSYYVSTSDISVASTGWNGSITVTKTDPDGNPIASPAVFELLDSMKNVKSTLATDADGHVVFDKLKLRTYYIREKTAPVGYSPDNTEYEVTISGDNAQTLNQTLSISNNPFTASIILYKTDESGKALSGGRFSVYSAADTAFKTPLQSVAAVNGVIRFTGLKAGDYIVREISAPAGYKLWTGDVPVSLVLDSTTNTLPNAVIDDPIINEPGYGSVQLKKVNSLNIPLSGAKFGLYASGYLIDTAVSDSNGFILFSNVPFGTYVVKEISAPDGYVLSAESAIVQVTDTGVNRPGTYVFVNASIPTYPPQTGGAPLFLPFVLIASALALFVIAKRKNGID